jgi:hypothetical protein
MANIKLDTEVKMRIMAREKIDKHELIDLFLSMQNSDKTRQQYKTCILDYIKWYNEHGELKYRHNILLSEKTDAMKYMQYCKTIGEKKGLSKSWWTNKHRGLGSLFSFVENNYNLPGCYFTNIFNNSKIKYKEYDGEGELFRKEIILITKKEIETIKKELLTSSKKGKGEMYNLAISVMEETGMRVGGIKGLSIKKEKRTGKHTFNTVSKENPFYKGVLSDKLVKKIIKGDFDLRKPFNDFEKDALQKAITRIKRKYKMDFTSGCNAFWHYAACVLYERTKDFLLV